MSAIRIFIRCYSSAIEKYGVSYHRIYAWVKKYEQRGVGGPADRRGKAKAVEEMSEVELLRAELRLKEAEPERVRMENMILKKSRR